MRVLVIGRQGQVARCLAERAPLHPTLQLAFAGRPEIDLEVAGSAAARIAHEQPDLVINAAAYTAVDLAESEPDRAFRINAEAVGEMARAAAECSAAFVHLSTDYVFDGHSTRPWREEDPTGPLNTYGASKLAGEGQVRLAGPDHLVLRTSWVYSAFGTNFARTMLSAARKNAQLRVVDDQHGCPTSAGDLASAILALAERRMKGDAAGWGEIYHLTGSEQCSWADFAEALFEESGKLGQPVPCIERISTSAWPTAAMRPRYSVLNCEKAAERLNIRLPRLRQSISPVVASILRSL